MPLIFSHTRERVKKGPKSARANAAPSSNRSNWQVHAAFATDKIELRLSVQNLFDKFYIDYSSDTRLPTDNLAFFAGRRRTFTLT
ncbi:hypothetical protein [Novosphingobium sp. BL-8A]|uniref:hypothetical protein n=1 Tax=Novosphingobium sp. BL-8A TaxID=3127639 RepID=UPI003757946A